MTDAEPEPPPALQQPSPPAWSQTMYADLHRIARHQLGAARDAHTLQPTALLHEAYVKLAAHAGEPIRDRGHFAALVSRVMRQILVDQARTKLAERHGGKHARLTLSGIADGADTPDYDVLALDEALHELAELNATKARLVELRFFAGLTETEAADALGMSRAEATRQWRMTRAWLAHRLRNDG